MNRRTITGLMLAIALSLGLGAPAATASAHQPRTGATGPFFIVALHYPACVKASPNRPGTTVIQGDYHARDCRKVFFDVRGHVNGKPYGRWETATPVHVLAAPNCDLVSLQNQNSVGDLWVENVSGGRLEMVSKHCDETEGLSNCVYVLAASGTIGLAWIVVDKEVHQGYFTAVRTVQQPVHLVPQLARSFHRQPSIQAGC